MSSKSKELLTVAAMDAAIRLRREGWRQKDYLSAGVIALERAAPAEQSHCRAMAHSGDGYLVEQVKVIFSKMNVGDLKVAELCLQEAMEAAGVAGDGADGGEGLRKTRRGTSAKLR